jgi:diguanylate cyclase (GGDEF)-like protein
MTAPLRRFIVAEKNYNQRFNVDYPAGRFDLSLNMIEGNPLAYRFFGSNTYFSIYRMIEPEEQQKLSDIAHMCLDNPDMRVDECVHIKRSETTECYVISIQKTKDIESFDVELINVSQSKNLINELNQNALLARDYLTINGDILFRYTPKTNNFHMYSVIDKQNIDLFNMDMDKWIEHIISEHLISDEDIETFETFCTILKNATVSQSYAFHGFVLSDKNVCEKYKVTFKPVADTNNETIVLGVWSVINEVTSDRESSTLEAAYLDGLTGLLNKKAITRYAENAVESVPSKGNQVALAVMDIDNFKSVNDNFGHLFGDKVIKAVSEAIKESIGNDAVAGRIGGDEFMIVFEKFEDELEYRNVLRCIKTKVNTIYQNRFGHDKLTCSIGLGRYGIGSCSTNYHDLFKIADKALYLAKQKGKNRYIIYKPEIHGDFNSPDDSSDVVNISTNFYSDDDIYKLYSLLSDTVIQGFELITDLLDKLAYVLMIDRINIFIGDSETPAYMNNNARQLEYQANPHLLDNPHYVTLFTRDKLVISNIHGIEFTLPDIYELLNSSHAYSLMQYILRDNEGNIAGFITADVLDHVAAFPKIAIQLFETTARTINSVLIRDGKI